MGEEIGTISIPVLQPDEEAVLSVPWSVPNPQDYEAINAEPWHFCLLARIVASEDPMAFAESGELYNNVIKNNNIAQRNITIVNLEPNSTQKPIGGTFAVGNLLNLSAGYSLEFIANDKETGKKIFEEAEVTVKLDSIVWKAWVKGGKTGTNISIKKNQIIIITGDHAKLENILFDPNEIGTVYLSFNFLTKEITNKEIYGYNVLQINDNLMKVVGGETYEIRKYPRGLFFADPGNDKEIDKNDTVVLSAEILNEPALYNWYDLEGNLIYQGKDFTISVEVATKYKLEVIAISDGFKDYSEILVKLKQNSLSEIAANPASNSVHVKYKINEGNSSYLAVNGIYGNNIISNNYIVDSNVNEITIDISNYPQGIYSITLITDGEISDTKTLIKQ